MTEETSDITDLTVIGDGGGSARYGEVLMPGWSARLETHRHPFDGARVVTASTPTAFAGRPTLVLLHGIGNDGRTFGPIIPVLAERGPVIAPRLNTDLFAVVDDPAESVAPFVEYLRALAPPPWHLVGHSMGGLLAGLLMRARPELVAGAVLLNSPLPGVSRRFRDGDTLDRTGRALLSLKALAQITALGRPRLPGFLGAVELTVVRNALRGFVDRPGALDDDVVRHGIVEARTRDADDFLRLARRLPDWELEPFTGVPVSVLAGRDDPLLPPADLELVSAAYPDAEVVVLDDVAHFVQFEAPRATVAMIAAMVDHADTTVPTVLAPDGRRRRPRAVRESAARRLRRDRAG